MTWYVVVVHAGLISISTRIVDILNRYYVGDLTYHSYNAI